jgi:hypothetical protein
MEGEPRQEQDPIEQQSAEILKSVDNRMRKLVKDLQSKEPLENASELHDLREDLEVFVKTVQEAIEQIGDLR